MVQKGISSIVIILIIVGVLVVAGGIYWWQKDNIKKLILGEQPKACTQEAKLCPDGSSVGRTGPHCEFAPCPETNETADWQTYRNEEYGFEIKYPNQWIFSEHSVGSDIGIRFDSSKIAQEGCDMNSRADMGANPFSCPENGFGINIDNGLTRDKYIDNFKGSALTVSQTEDIIISGKKFTKIIFANYSPQYIIEGNGWLLIFSSVGAYDRTDQIILSTFKFID